MPVLFIKYILKKNRKGLHFKQVLILVMAFAMGQPLYGQETRKISGTVRIDGEVLIGQSIREHATQNATTTQINGEFELMIPTEKPVLLHLSQCFSQGYILITPDMEWVDIQLDRKFFRKSKRAYKRWKRNKDKYPSIEPAS